MRYYDTITRTEINKASEHTIPSDDERVVKFFQPLAQGEAMIYGEDNLPYFYMADNFVKPIVVDGVVVEGITQEEIAKQTLQRRYARLESIFSSKAVTLKKMAIDKEYMQDYEAINNQYRIYEEMYKNALAGYYDEPTNDEIIAMNTAMKQAMAPVVLALNEVRSSLQKKIEESTAINIDGLLDYADSIVLTREELTPEKLAELVGVFG